MYRLLKMVNALRRVVNRHPRFVWLLARFIRQWPRLERHLTHYYGIRLPTRVVPASSSGYRLPFVTMPEQLLKTERDWLRQLE